MNTFTGVSAGKALWTKKKAMQEIIMSEKRTDVT